jgi:hypothetical protein
VRVPPPPPPAQERPPESQVCLARASFPHYIQLLIAHGVPQDAQGLDICAHAVDAAHRSAAGLPTRLWLCHGALGLGGAAEAPGSFYRILGAFCDGAAGAGWAASRAAAAPPAAGRDHRRTQRRQINTAECPSGSKGVGPPGARLWHCCRCAGRAHSPSSVPQVSAVSPKTNTTARCCLGAFAEGETQVVLFDTPGVVSPK